MISLPLVVVASNEKVKCTCSKPSEESAVVIRRQIPRGDVDFGGLNSSFVMKYIVFN